MINDLIFVMIVRDIYLQTKKWYRVLVNLHKVFNIVLFEVATRNVKINVNHICYF